MVLLSRLWEWLWKWSHLNPGSQRVVSHAEAGNHKSTKIPPFLLPTLTVSSQIPNPLIYFQNSPLNLICFLAQFYLGPESWKELCSELRYHWNNGLWACNLLRGDLNYFTTTTKKKKRLWGDRHINYFIVHTFKTSHCIFVICMIFVCQLYFSLKEIKRSTPKQNMA